MAAVANFVHAVFNAALHPRGPNGRFTRSSAKPMGGKDRAKARKIKAGFSGHKLNGPDDARAYLSHLSGSPPGQPSPIRQHMQSGALGRATQALRAGKTTPETAAIDKAMKPLPDDLVLYRSVPSDKFGHADPKSLEGLKVTDAGYFPATVAPQKSAPGNVQLHIQAPAGTHAAADPDTGQVVLGHGTPMSVEHVEVGPDGSTRMDLVAMPPEGEASTSGTAPSHVPASPDRPTGTPDGASVAVPDHARPYHESLGGLEGLADRIETQGVAERHALAAGEVGEVERIVLDDGTVVFYKRNTDWDDDRTAEVSTDSEQLAASIGAALGAPVPRVYRTGPDTMYTDWAQGRSSIELWSNPMAARMDRPPDNDVIRGLAESPEGRRLGLMDVLTHNTDRHPGNVLVTDDGQLTGIDHGMAWMDGVTAEGLSDEEFLQAARADMRGPFMQNFFDEDHYRETDEVRLRDLDFLSPGDVAEMRQRLEALRPEFERLGRGGWLDYSQRMLSLIEPHATGTGSIFDG